MNSELLVCWSRVKQNKKTKATNKQKKKTKATKTPNNSISWEAEAGEPVLALLGYSTEFKTGLAAQAQAGMLGFWSLLSPDQ